MKLSRILLCLLSCSVSTSIIRSKRDANSIVKKTANTLVQTTFALTALKTYKDNSKALAELIQVFIMTTNSRVSIFAPHFCES